MYSGKSIARLEDARFLTGRGRYVSDMLPADALHAVVLRSPHAHAVLAEINAQPASAMPGVVGVFTSADLAADNLAPLPCTAVLASVSPMVVPPRPVLARRSCRLCTTHVVLLRTNQYGWHASNGGCTAWR